LNTRCPIHFTRSDFRSARLSASPRCRGQRFVAFYEAWYRPERATIVVTGDVKADEIRTLIEKEFATAATRGPARAEPNLGKLTTGQGVTARWSTLRDASSTTVTIANYHSRSKQADTLARQKTELTEMLANLMLNRRLAKLAEVPGSLFSEASSDSETLSFLFNETGVTAKCEPSKCREVVAVLEQEIRRVVQHGFSKHEVDEIKQLLNAGVAHLASQAESRSPATLATSLLESVHKHEVF
jgi:zinc protease